MNNTATGRIAAPAGDTAAPGSTGRRALTSAEEAELGELGELGAKLSLVLG
ncbi:hypothetical protein [Micromonospora musae]|uniref:hypothetical protein n=1 Tax=Micromonospora musae TaxID=1894970 RepID=UPI0033F5B620